MPNFPVISLNPTTNKRTRTRIYLKTRERERERQKKKHSYRCFSFSFFARNKQKDKYRNTSTNIFCPFFISGTFLYQYLFYPFLLQIITKNHGVQNTFRRKLQNNCTNLSYGSCTLLSAETCIKKK